MLVLDLSILVFRSAIYLLIIEQSVEFFWHFRRRFVCRNSFHWYLGKWVSLYLRWILMVVKVLVRVVLLWGLLKVVGVHERVTSIIGWWHIIHMSHLIKLLNLL